MTVAVAWASGGSAALASLRDGAVVVVSTVSSPPGSRIEGQVATTPPSRLRMKVHGCKRQDDGGYRIEGRVIDMSRVDRERIEAALVAT